MKLHTGDIYQYFISIIIYNNGQPTITTRNNDNNSGVASLTNKPFCMSIQCD